MEHSNRLDAAIESLFGVFKRYQLNDPIPFSPYADLERDERVLHSRPLRELTWSELGVFSFRAMTTYGSLEDFKHLLPRIIELCIRDAGGTPYDLETILGKLGYGSWRTWPPQEQRAIEEALRTWYVVLLNGCCEDEHATRAELESTMRTLDMGLRDA